MFKKIVMAYNGSRDGKEALLQCCEIASFTKAETHLLAVAGMPSSMFLTEGFLPEELLEEEKKRLHKMERLVGELEGGLHGVKEEISKKVEERSLQRILAETVEFLEKNAPAVAENRIVAQR